MTSLPNQANAQSPVYGVATEGGRSGELLLGAEGGAFDFDFRRLFSLLYRQRVGMGIIVGACLLLGLAAILLLPKIYEAHSSVQIDQSSAKVLGTEEQDPISSVVDADRFLQTQVDILNSRDQAGRVADKLGLAANTDFLTAMGAKMPDENTPAELRGAVIDALQDALQVDLPRSTRVVNITVKSRDPKLAMQIANAYSDVFIASNVERKYQTSDYARTFLKSQITQAKASLEASEKALLAYARSANLLDVSAGVHNGMPSTGAASLVTSQLVDVNSNLSAATTARIAAEQHWGQVKSQPALTMPEVLSNPAVQTMLQRRSDANAALFQLRQHLKPDHPSVLQAQAQYEEVDKELGALAENLKRSVYEQYLIAKAQEQSITGQVNKLTTDTLSEQDRQVQYNTLKREVDTNRELFESLMQRFDQVNAEAGISANNITPVDVAEMPTEPSSPRRLLILFLSLFGGVGLAVFYAFARDYLDDAIRNPTDVEVKLGVPLLGVIPAVSEGEPAKLIDQPKSAIAEAYNSVRTSIELSSSQGLFPTLLVSSASKGEGKSTTAYAIARQFATINKRVLLVDVDMRRPSLHRFFGQKLGDKGFSSALAGLHGVDDVIQQSGIENLSFMVAGPLPPDPASLLASGKAHELVHSLTERFDLVLLDGPPVLALADALQLSALADATVFVVEAGETQLGQTRNAISRLTRANGKLIGAVVTKYSAEDDRYSYYNSYYNYRYEN